MKDNIVAHLHKQLLPQCVIKEILSDIFGTATEKGLIHALDREFDTKVKVLQNRSNLLEKPYKKEPVVYRWFVLHIAPVTRDNLRSEILHDLGLDKERYTQNHSESLNALVKRYVDFQKQDILQFVNDLEECVREQQNEVIKATVGLGRWTVSPSYAHIKQNTSNWFGSLSLAEKQDTVSSLHKSSPLFPTPSSSLGAADAHEDSEDVLSVPCSSIKGLLSDGLIISIWRKASQLLKGKKVIKAPDSNPKRCDDY